MKLILLGVVAILIVIPIYLHLRRRRTSDATRGDPHALEDTRFHAVSIHYLEGACSAAKMLSGKRFLAEDAPKLPLPGCDTSECRCRFTHYEDRRTAAERRSPFSSVSYGGTEHSRLQEREARAVRRPRRGRRPRLHP